MLCRACASLRRQCRRAADITQRGSCSFKSDRMSWNVRITRAEVGGGGGGWVSPTDSVKVGAAGSIKRASAQTGLCKSSQHTNGLHTAALPTERLLPAEAAQCRACSSARLPSASNSVRIRSLFRQQRWSASSASHTWMHRFNSANHLPRTATSLALAQPIDLLRVPSSTAASLVPTRGERTG